MADFSLNMLWGSVILGTFAAVVFAFHKYDEQIRRWITAILISALVGTIWSLGGAARILWDAFRRTR